MCPVYLQKIQVPPLQGAVRNFKVYQNDENVNRESTESRQKSPGHRLRGQNAGNARKTREGCEWGDAGLMR